MWAWQATHRSSLDAHELKERKEDAKREGRVHQNFEDAAAPLLRADYHSVGAFELVIHNNSSEHSVCHEMHNHRKLFISK